MFELTSFFTFVVGLVFGFIIGVVCAANLIKWWEDQAIREFDND